MKSLPNKKIIKNLNSAFYIFLLISFVSITGHFIHGLIINNKKSFGSALLLGYLNLYFLIPSIGLLLLAIVIYQIYHLGLIQAIKESSLNIYALALSVFIIWVLSENAKYSGNKINVEVINRTTTGIANIKILGRNALTHIDTLGPNQNKSVIFRGKNINYSTENDYENEISVLYYFENQWHEKEILKGFSRWRVLDDDLRIEIFSPDSINVLLLERKDY